MTAILLPRTAPTQGLWSRLDQRGRAAIICGFAAAVAVMGAGGSTMARALVGLFGLVVFVLVAFSGRDTALTLVIVWLVLLGFVRRLLIPFAGWASNDPLLLLSPAAALTLWFTGRRQQPAPTSALAGLTGFLLVWALAQMANPTEPSLLVAAQGLLFYFTPLVWFFVGRTLTGDQHDRILKTVLWMNLIVAGHGLYQSFVGFLPFELTWLHVSNQGAAIFLPGFKVRPFSTLVSPQEYGAYLAFAAAVIWALVLHPRRASPSSHRRWLVAFLLFTLVALFFQGARGALIGTILALTVMLIARLRSFVAFVFVAALVVVASMWVGNQSVSQDSGPKRPTKSEASSDAVVTHQLSGLTDPSSSSATLHIDQAVAGFEQGMRNPLGLGVSEATIAAARREGATVTPENDIGNTLVALGLPGGLALIGIIIAGLSGSVRLYRLEPSARHLAWLGILVGSVGQWLNGSLYAVSTILFLTLGGMAREIGQRTRRAPAERWSPPQPARPPLETAR